MSHFLPTSTSVDERHRASKIAVLPIGSFEQHGGHLPLSTDSIIAMTIARAVSEAYDLFLLPPLTIACSHEHAGWPGTVSISSVTLTAIIKDIVDSLRASGIERLLLVNAHGGNYVLSNIVQEASVAGPFMALFPSRSDWTGAIKAGALEADSHDDMHAGEIETSILLHACPEVVRSDYQSADEEAIERPHMLTLGLRAYTSSGVVGRPSLATPEKGKAFLAHLVKAASSHVNCLNSGKTE